MPKGPLRMTPGTLMSRRKTRPQSLSFLRLLPPPHPFVRSGYHPFVPTCAQPIAIARSGGQGWHRLRGDRVSGAQRPRRPRARGNARSRREPLTRYEAEPACSGQAIVATSLCSVGSNTGIPTMMQYTHRQRVPILDLVSGMKAIGCDEQPLPRIVFWQEQQRKPKLMIFRFC
jgi:hypothetical protein